MSPRNFCIFTMRKFRDSRTIVVRMPYDSRTIVARQSSRLSGEKIKLSDIRANVVRHSHECLATVVRMKMKLHVKLRSWERRETISRVAYVTKNAPVDFSC